MRPCLPGFHGGQNPLAHAISHSVLPALTVRSSTQAQPPKVPTSRIKSQSVSPLPLIFSHLSGLWPLTGWSHRTAALCLRLDRAVFPRRRSTSLIVSPLPSFFSPPSSFNYAGLPFSTVCASQRAPSQAIIMDPLPLAGAAEVEDIEMPDAQDLDFLALQVDQMTIAHKITDSEVRTSPAPTTIAR